MPIRKSTKLLVVHVTATPPSSDIGAKEVRAMHKQKGWSDIGYHYVIRRNGVVEPGRAQSQIGAHVAGFNSVSLGVSMVGGVNGQGKAEDNATEAQYASLEVLLKRLHDDYPAARVCGHRDLSPDGDGDGVIERGEWIKECPCFNAIPWAISKGLPGADIRGEWAQQPVQPNKPSAPEKPAGPDSRMVYLQKLLARAGFTFGPIDGIFGPKTAKAIRAFQKGYELPITGEFDARTVQKLRAMFE